jgi:hypothetical protein
MSLQSRLAFIVLLAFAAISSAQRAFTCDDGPFTCNDDAAPICASDGVTYQNHCHFFTAYCSDQRIMFVKEGECDGSAAPGYDSKDENDGDSESKEGNDAGSVNDSSSSSISFSSDRNQSNSSASSSTSKNATQQSSASAATVSLAVLFLSLLSTTL